MIAKPISLFGLLIISVASSCWARFLVPVDLCYTTQTKQCSTGTGSNRFDSSDETCSPLNIPFGGASSTTRILRGGKSSCRGGSTVVATNSMTMPASRMQLLNLLSGGVAGTIASCITNPLEVIKTQLQSSSAVVGELSAAGGHPLAIAKKIFERDGVFGFFY